MVPSQAELRLSKSIEGIGLKKMGALPSMTLQMSPQKFTVLPPPLFLLLSFYYPYISGLYWVFLIELVMPELFLSLLPTNYFCASLWKLLLQRT